MIIESLNEEQGDIVAFSGDTLKMKLLQLSNGAVYDDDGKVIQIHDGKINMLEEIIDEAQGQLVLVFYNFKHDEEKILSKFKEVETLDSDNAVERWNNGEINILIAHPASAGHGLNLQKGGHIIVWFGLTWDLELYQQANARLHRQGQKETTIIHHIMTEGSVDQEVYKSLTD